MRKYGRDNRSFDAHHYSEPPFPWKQIMVGVAIVFLTGLVYLFSQIASYFAGTILGVPKSLLGDLACPSSSFSFEVSPIPGLFSYEKGNLEANRKELLRINSNNHGITAWFSYDKGFAEGTKAKLIDQIAYERNPDQYLVNLFEAIKSDASPHGAVDLVTKWLSSENVNLPTVFPYTSGLVVDAVTGDQGYGNYVSVCSEVTNGQDRIKILYSVAHLDSLSVSSGQMVSSGQELGKIGTTGKSTTPHAHISIMPDLYFLPNYRQVYNGGYKFYYPTSIPEVLVKNIDPISVILNPDIAYSIALSDTKRQKIFENAEQYVMSLQNTVASISPELLVASVLPPTPSFQDFRITTDHDRAKIKEWISVTVEAIDQNGQIFPPFFEEINVVLSSSSAQFLGVKTMQAGKTNFQITDTIANEVTIQISNHGSISEEKKVSFRDELKFLELTAPQKITLGTSAIVVIRPIGTLGGIIEDPVDVSLNIFPSIDSSTTPLQVAQGRSEYSFSASQEGIYELRFSAEGLSESIQIALEKPVTVSVQTPEAQPVLVASEEPVLTAAPLQPEIKPAEQAVATPVLEKPVVVQEPKKPDLKNPDKIVILPGDQYRLYDVSGNILIVFNDRNVTSEYPVEMKFTVPEGTDSVSVFSGLNTLYFPSEGELKLSKYVKGQAFVRYFPKFVIGDSFKKIVAFKEGVVFAEKVFTWSSASQHGFIDVVKGVTPENLYDAILSLKESGVFKGNPDGSFGIDQSLNRASAATILIRSFYSDVNLDQLTIKKIPFTDVSKNAWYAKAIWFASQRRVQGEVKPIIIKGSNKKAFPDNPVKLEEFLTMIFRILELDLKKTKPWYQSAIQKGIELKFITEEDKKLIDKPLSRGKVAEILVEALDYADSLTVTIQDEKKL